MFKSFYPDCYMNSTYEIDFDAYYEKGYRGVIFDIDNTLVPHGAPADERSKKLLAEIENEDLKLNKYEKTSKDISVKLAFLEAEKEYIVTFLEPVSTIEIMLLSPSFNSLEVLPKISTFLPSFSGVAVISRGEISFIYFTFAL